METRRIGPEAEIAAVVGEAGRLHATLAAVHRVNLHRHFVSNVQGASRSALNQARSS